MRLRNLLFFIFDSNNDGTCSGQGSCSCGKCYCDDTKVQSWFVLGCRKRISSIDRDSLIHFVDCYWLLLNCGECIFKRSSLIVKRFPQKRYPPSYLSGRWFTDFESKHRSSCHIALLPFLAIKMIVIACSVKITPPFGHYKFLWESTEATVVPSFIFFIGSQRINLWWLMRVWHPELPKRPWKWRDMWRRRYVYYV